MFFASATFCDQQKQPCAITIIFVYCIIWLWLPFATIKLTNNLNKSIMQTIIGEKSLNLQWWNSSSLLTLYRKPSGESNSRVAQCSPFLTWWVDDVTCQLQQYYTEATVWQIDKNHKFSHKNVTLRFSNPTMHIWKIKFETCAKCFRRCASLNSLLDCLIACA